ncbi:MAG: class I SAM-dependent methyltransferase [Deltaproteobacteria bacterium]|nr:class I SAM-dependent methyltransferase [Deltaproteobacteria bacterium]
MGSLTKEHWEKVYETKSSNELSWFQSYPKTSVELISGLNLPKTAAIIDVGGGDGRLVGALLKQGFVNLHVLDISARAIERAKARLRGKADGVIWIVSDITEFSTEIRFDLWHDRAAFHFLVDETQIGKYIETANKNIREGGCLMIGAFSEKGPKRCSGLDVRRYSETAMAERLKGGFEKIRCVEEDHTTPSGACQNFLFCGFMRRGFKNGT